MHTPAELRPSGQSNAGGHNDFGQATPPNDSFASATLTATKDEVEGDDDHANSVEGASTLPVGETAQGASDYDGDSDFFVFEAEEGYCTPPGGKVRSLLPSNRYESTL